MNKDDFEKRLSLIKNNFSSQKDKIGATGKKAFFVLENMESQKARKDFNLGKAIKGIDLIEISRDWKSKDIFIDEEGNPFVLYIPDLTSYRGKEESPRKYHLSWCTTLESMRKNGRSDRYIKKDDIENLDFKCKTSSDEDVVRQLHACEHCRNRVVKKFGGYNEFDIENLDLVFFFEKYGKLIRDGGFKTGTYSVTYPESWAKISKRIREKSDWKCNQCKKDFSTRKNFLDVDHKNGIKSDVTNSNLWALCKKCHSERPYHGHYKNIT